MPGRSEEKKLEQRRPRTPRKELWEESDWATEVTRPGISPSVTLLFLLLQQGPRN